MHYSDQRREHFSLSHQITADSSDPSLTRDVSREPSKGRPRSKEADFAVLTTKTVTAWNANITIPWYSPGNCGLISKGVRNFQDVALNVKCILGVNSPVYVWSK